MLTVVSLKAMKLEPLDTGVPVVERVRAALASGADLLARDEFGWTLLHEAACEGDAEAVRLLICAGAEPNVVVQGDGDDNYGQTPLHCAARNGNLESVRALVAAGADVSARAEEGETPLHVAVVFGSSELAYARSHPGDEREGKGKSGALPRGFTRYVESVKVLLNAGADPSARTELGVTPLHLAVDGDFFGD